MSQDPHGPALRALLEAHPHLTVYPRPDAPAGEIVPAGALPPYVVLYTHVHYQGDGRFPNESQRAIARAVCHSVGGTVTAAEVVAGNVREALLDAEVTIAGRECWPVRHEQSVGPQPDESLGRLVMDQMDVYRLDSEPG